MMKKHFKLRNFCTCHSQLTITFHDAFFLQELAFFSADVFVTFRARWLIGLRKGDNLVFIKCVNRGKFPCLNKGFFLLISCNISGGYEKESQRERSL
jgi:hypothetical protein